MFSLHHRWGNFFSPLKSCDPPEARKTEIRPFVACFASLYFRLDLRHGRPRLKEPLLCVTIFAWLESCSAQSLLCLRHQSISAGVNSNLPPPLSSGMNDSATGGSGIASSVGGGSTKGDIARKKSPTSLWSYILPCPAESNPNSKNASIMNTASEREKLPTTSPMDRNAISIRLALGDTQSAVQKLADRVDRVLDLQREEAKNVQDVIGRVVQSGEWDGIECGGDKNSKGLTPVSPRMRLGFLGLGWRGFDPWGWRCGDLLFCRCSDVDSRVLLSAAPLSPSWAIFGNNAVEQAFTALNEATVAHTSKLDEALSRIARIESTLTAQSVVMTEIGAKCDVHFSVLDKFGSLPPIIPILQSLPTSIQNSHLSTTQALERSSQNQLHVLSAETTRWMAEHQSATRASLDKLKEEVRNALDANREAWSMVLSLNRQEMSAMFSAVLAGIRNVPGSTGTVSISGSGSASSTGSAPSGGHAQVQIAMDSTTTARAQESGTPQTIALNDITPHTFEPHGKPSSITHSYSQERMATKPEKTHVAQHAAENSNAQARHIQASAVHDKNSTRPEVLQPGRVLVEDTQSTVLSSIPDEEEIVEHMAGRGFGALGERASSPFGSFNNPDSPGFTIHRQPFVQSSKLQPPLGLTEEKSNGHIFETGSRSVSLAPTLARSSSPGNAPSIRLIVKKRSARAEDVPPVPTKRSRKTKTRVLMDSQELLMLDSSPER
ncbi:unnamed protein product [Rhizoctonia solani]|uniref:Uncharacterized protein n=1 Tax=Rhizoctonia solani TaxID=456999 RepID=A0A8H3BNH3_9AGAM|nr:unnamed protein product [Rhizoctonia solani]